MVAKKNIKTTLAACIGLIMLHFDGEQGSQVYAAASNAKQARICFRAARQIALKSPALKKRFEILNNNISHLGSASFFEYISSQSAQTKDGLNPHCAIIDEYHAHPDNEVHDVLDSATASREEPLIYIISTAGFNTDGPCKKMQDYCEKMLDPDQPVEDDSIFAMIFTLDKDDDWANEDNWIKANPSLGVSVKRDDLRAKARTAKQLPSQLNNFLTKHMNQWTESKEAFILPKKWNLCGTEELKPVSRNYEEFLAEISGKQGYAGLDLGSVDDFTAFVLCIRSEDEGLWDVYPMFWIPSETVKDRKNKDTIRPWVKQGWIETTHGDTTDHDFVEKRIKEICSAAYIQEVVYDRYRMDQMINHLMDEGIEVTPFGQGYVSMNPAVDNLEKLILEKKIEHFNNPVLAWMNSNVSIKKDPAGNRKFDKQKSQDKIDGIVAMAMALERGMNAEDLESDWQEFKVI